MQQAGPTSPSREGQVGPYRARLYPFHHSPAATGHWSLAEGKGIYLSLSVFPSSHWEEGQGAMGEMEGNIVGAMGEMGGNIVGAVREPPAHVWA